MGIERKKQIVVVSVEVALALVFIIGADWAGERINSLFHSYFSDIALPFGFYFLLIMLEGRFPILRQWKNKALAVFSLVSASEIMQYFGLYALASIFDPMDIVMYASGVLLAALADMKVFSRIYPLLHS